RRSGAPATDGLMPVGNAGDDCWGGGIVQDTSIGQARGAGLLGWVVAAAIALAGCGAEDTSGATPRRDPGGLIPGGGAAGTSVSGGSSGTTGGGLDNPNAPPPTGLAGDT